MSLILPDQRAGYKLIPQSNSEDSELSEEELDSLFKDGFQIITKKHINPINRREHIHSINEKASKMSSENFDLKAKNIFPSDGENVTYELRTMSKERRTSLFLSILLCLSTIAVFLTLPCEWGNCCCSKTLKGNGKIWFNVFSNIEIKGAIRLVQNMFGDHYNLLFMACGSMFADSPIIRSDVISPSGGDIIVLNGLNGRQIWRKHFNNMPTDADCSLIYNKNRSINECIMVGHGDYVALISSDEGKLIWNFPGNSVKYNRVYDQFPVILPDLDGDEVREIATIKDSNKIVLLSGLTGANLLNNLTNEDCIEISQLEYIDKLSLRYSCKLKNETSKPVTIALKHYLNILPTTKKGARLTQHRSHYSQQNTVKHHTIHVKNKGMFCPYNCTSNIYIYDKRIDKTVWVHDLRDSFAMKPNIFYFHDSELHGFVLKIWQHEYEKTNPKKLKIHQHNPQFTVGYIFERTVAVVFNSTLHEPMQIINISLNPILQLYDHKTLQPDPKFQENSTLILDLNKNGSYQLVTYYSTFEEVKKNYHIDTFNKNPYTLKSYIKMYDLKIEIHNKLVN